MGVLLITFSATLLFPLKIKLLLRTPGKAVFPNLMVYSSLSSCWPISSIGPQGHPFSFGLRLLLSSQDATPGLPAASLRPSSWSLLMSPPCLPGSVPRPLSVTRNPLQMSGFQFSQISIFSPDLSPELDPAGCPDLCYGVSWHLKPPTMCRLYVQSMVSSGLLIVRSVACWGPASPHSLSAPSAGPISSSFERYSESSHLSCLTPATLPRCCRSSRQFCSWALHSDLHTAARVPL